MGRSRGSLKHKSLARAGEGLGLGGIGTIAPLEVVLLAVVEADEHEGTAETTENVRAGTLEHGANTLAGENLAGAVDG